MTRGDSTQYKVHLKKGDTTFVIFVDDPELYKKWKTDKSIPLAHFVSAFKIFETKQGVQGTLDAAPKSTLAAAFDSENEDEVIKKILEDGAAQLSEMPERQGPRNDSMSATNTK